MQNKNLHDLCWQLGLAFCSTQLLTQIPSLTSKNCCDVDIHVIVGILCEVVSPNFHALNGSDWTGWPSNDLALRATSHTKLRARDHYTSNTLIGGKGWAGPSSLLHTTLEGPMECVNARWMESLHKFLHGIKWIMFHGHLDYFQKPPLGGRSNTKLGDHGTPNAHNRWFILLLSCVRTCMNRNSLK
jgi:hypothetical protein